MAMNEARAQAYAQLEEAIENIRRVHGYNDLLAGWTVLTNSINPLGDSHECDEMDMEINSGMWSRRGQNPVLSYGMICEAKRYCDSIQLRHEIERDE